MKLAEAIAAFEAKFVVHGEVGLPNADYDGPVDPSRAPTGEPYVVLVSSGPKADGERPRFLYTSEADAVADWLHYANEYAEGAGRHLYWRRRPEIVSHDFVPIQQAAALRDERLRDCLTLPLCYVYSRLVVSRMRPDGTEDSE